MDTIPLQAPDGIKDIIAHYGDPGIQIENGTWTVSGAWEYANCTTIQHALLPLGKLYVHRFIAQPTLSVLDRWLARIKAGDPYKLRTMGCFCPRAQRGSAGIVMSLHTLAIAWDVNADTNRLISPCAPQSAERAQKDIPDAWIADARTEGFFWGGDFERRFDPMHFQLATGA